MKDQRRGENGISIGITFSGIPQTLLLVLFSLIAFGTSAQNKDSFFKVAFEPTADMPQWQQLMYSDDPVVEEVVQAYDTYYAVHEFVKDIHARNYSHWLQNVSGLIDTDGRIEALYDPGYITKMNSSRQQHAARSAGGSSVWNPVGPFETYRGDGSGQKEINHANVVTFAAAPSNHNVLYCSSEGGTYFKSLNKGITWSSIGEDWFYRNAQDIAVHPTDPNVVLVASDNLLHMSIDGGVNWHIALVSFSEITCVRYNPMVTGSVFLGTGDGLFTSLDGGFNWSGSSITNKVWDIVFKPGDATTAYAAVSEPSLKRSVVYKTVTNGIIWNSIQVGWYFPSDFGNARELGCKLGVTPADPERLYAALIGDSKSGDNGWIGVYYSTNSGSTWVNADGIDGGPYSGSATAGNNWFFPGYGPPSFNYVQQGWYNFDLAVSPTDADKIWVGTVWTMESTNRGAGFTNIGLNDFCNSGGTRDLDLHVDVQDIDVVGSEVWIATDGGLDYSSDELQSVEPRRYGIYAKQFWGFDQGWNEDTYNGGTYHVGNAVYHENYGSGNAMQHKGVERATGYINKMYNKECAYKPEHGCGYLGGGGNFNSSNSLTQPAVKKPNFQHYPNESTATMNSSELEHDPRYSDHIYLGKNNLLYKSLDAGSTASVLHTFPANSRVQEIEISRIDPSIIYLVLTQGSTSSIQKSTDGGQNFAPTTTLPTSKRAKLDISLSALDLGVIWAVTSNGDDGFKVFRSANGGSTWSNMTTSALNGENPKDICIQQGTDEIVYLLTEDGFFYYDSATSNWSDYDLGLPFRHNGFKIIPFYRDNKIRLASRKGVWEAPMVEQSFVLAQPMTDKPTVTCTTDTVQLECYSILNHWNAEWNWSISPAPAYISDPSARNPKVVLNVETSYDVTLQIFDGFSYNNDVTIVDMLTLESTCPTDVYGCMDQSACNYNPSATIDDGSCEYVGQQWYLPVDYTSSSSEPAVLTCSAPSGYELAGSQSCVQQIFDADPFCGTTDWDGACDAAYQQCYLPGCTDPQACNYDPQAQSDDGSCSYEGQSWYLPIDYSTSSSMPAVLACEAPDGYQLALNQSCVESVVSGDSFCGEDDWDGICEDAYSACNVPACTDPEACNYDPQAVEDDGSCFYGLWYIPDSIPGGGQAVMACEPPQGYSLADQDCAQSVIDNDAYCQNTDWDDICSSDYQNCLGGSDCAVFDTAPVDLTKSFDPVNGVQDRVQVKWFKESPQVRYTDEDAAMCDIKFWKKRTLDPQTGVPFGPAIQNPDTLLISDAKKTYGDNSPREIFKWPIKFRADGANNNKRAEPNFRYEWQVRCECGHSGDGQESPWSAIKIFNTPDFDPATGIYTPAAGAEGDVAGKSSFFFGTDFVIYPNPSDGEMIQLEFSREGTLNTDPVRVRVYDMSGSMVHQQVLTIAKSGEVKRLTFDSRLPAGVYMLEASQSDLLNYERFIVK